MAEEKKEKKKRSRRTMYGQVVSTKMQKTAIVLVKTKVLHSIYKKYYTRRKRYKVHDPEQKCSIGDFVRIVESSPASKEKRWRLETIYKK